MKSNNKIISGAFLGLSLLLMPSCKWFNKKNNPSSSQIESSDRSTVLLSIDGKPVMTEKSFNEFLDQLIETDPQIGMMIQIIPDFKEQVFRMKKRAVIFTEWAKREGIRDSEEYKKKQKQFVEGLLESMDSDYFIKNHKIDVSDEDAKTYFEQNKESDPRLLITAAGVKVQAVAFDKESDAREFAQALEKSASKDLIKLAEGQKLSAQDLGPVNEDSFVDSKVKDAVLSIKTFPVIKVVKGEDGKFWVVRATGKQEAEYRNFDEVKEMVKRMLAPRKMEEMLDAELPKLEEKYNIKENKEFFEKIKRENEEAAQQAMEALEQESSEQEAQSSQADKELASAA